MSLQYRYPGAQPFQTKESHVFYGRTEVSHELYQLISLEPLVVLHAKSGLGKSSVVNAGLMPIVAKNQEYDPFHIRFHAFIEGTQEFPLGITREVVQSQSDLLDKIRPEGDDSLWYHLKSLQLATTGDKGLILVFDQFEELFTYSDAVIQEFAQQLSEAFYSTLPQRFRELRREGFEKDKNFLSEAELVLLDQPLNLRLLLIIRSDRISLIKKIKAYFPTILSADFELQPLERAQAEDAILSPAYQKTGFITPVFDYEDDAIEYLLDFLSEGGTEPIESFQLQILCEFVEQHLVQKQGKTLIQKADIANPDQILENYYLGKINSITNPEDRLAARRLIEEGFIFEEEERRLTLYEGQIFKGYGINQDLLNQLLDTHLIRSEPSLRGGYTYELSHDTLVVPVLKAKAKRKDAERLIREKEESQEREAELITLRQKEEAARLQAEKEKGLRTAAEKNEKRAGQRTRLAMMVSVLALLLSGLAFWFWNDAKAQTRLAEESKFEAVEQKLLAEESKLKADSAKIEAEAQTRLAEERTIEAKKQKTKAEESKTKALAQTRLAEKSQVEAEFAKEKALRQKKLAEKSQFEAETQKERAAAAAVAAQNAALALTVSKKNPTLALRIADYNLKKHKDNSAASIAFREIFNNSKTNFYKEIQNDSTESSLDWKSNKLNKTELWDAIKNKESLSFEKDDLDEIESAIFSPNGKRFLAIKNQVLDNNDKLRLWDVEKGKKLYSYTEGLFPPVITSVCFSPDGEKILMGDVNGLVKLLGIEGNILQTFRSSGKITSVSFSSDGKSILTESEGNTKRWDIKNNEDAFNIGDFGFAWHSSIFSPDGKSILSQSNGIELHNLKSDEKQNFEVPGLGEKGFNPRSLSALNFSVDGLSILAAYDDETIIFWDVKSKESKILRSNRSSFISDVQVTSIKFDHQYKHLHLKSKDGKINHRMILPIHNSRSFGVNVVTSSPDGKSILKGNKDGKAILSTFKNTRSEIEMEHSNYTEVIAVSFSPDGQMILTGGMDGVVKLWDLYGNEWQSFYGHRFPVNAVSFSPDGQYILASSLMESDGIKEWLMPQPFLDQKVQEFTLQELYDAGTILTKEDLKKVKQKE